MSSQGKPQPAPSGGSANIFDLLHEDLRERERIGNATYGQPLMAHDGRDTMRDLFDEELDRIVYLRKAIEEWKDCGPERVRKLLGLIGRQTSALQDIAALGPAEPDNVLRIVGGDVAVKRGKLFAEARRIAREALPPAPPEERP